MRVAFPVLLGLVLMGCTGDEAPGEVPFAQLRLGAVLGETDTTGFARAEGPREFSFPADHGPHEAFRSEWWYLTLMLQAADGREFGGQFTLFRQALEPRPQSDNPWLSNHVYLAHLALTDVDGGRHLAAERFARGHPALAGARADPFEVHLEDWRLAAAAGNEHWHLEARAASHGFVLDLEPAKSMVLQGDAGLSRKGPGQASYYYSFSRLQVSGAVHVGDETVPVTGSGWFDREWSTSVLGSGQVGWDWFALQLEDGRDFMGFQLRRRDGARDPYDHAVVVDDASSARTLTPEQFLFEPLRLWRDDEGVAWPVEWRVTAAGERWLLRAAIDDQRMDVSVSYWEGLVHVYDEAGGRLGRGYVEMTGYADE